MDNVMVICNGEVTLPGGVVAQPLWLDKSQPSGLRLSHRYPLGLFKEHGLLEVYIEMVKTIDGKLAMPRPKRERKNDQAQLFFSDFMRNQWELDAYESTMAISGIIVDYIVDFNECGVDLRVCHRARMDPTSHQPVVDRWIEYIDTSVAPQGYRSQWCASSTILMPVCLCLQTYSLLHVIIPNVATLKLLPLSRGGTDLFTHCPERLKGLMELKGLKLEYSHLLSDMTALPMFPKSGLWKSDFVEQVILQHKAAFRAKRINIYYCKLFCLQSVDRLFQWVEFVDMDSLPDYVPQYINKPFTPPPHCKRVIKTDRYCEEKYVKYAKLQAAKNQGNFIRKRGKWLCKNPPPVYWYDDKV